MAGKSLEERVKSLEEQVMKLEAINEVAKVFAKYCYTMDSGDWKGVMSCYAKECAADFGSFGGGKTRAEVEAFYYKQIKTKFALLYHRITNPIVVMKDENHAFGMWYLDEPCVLQATKNAAWLALTYFVDFVKEDGKWLMKMVDCRDCRWVTDYHKGWTKEPYTADPGHIKEPRAFPPIV